MGNAPRVPPQFIQIDPLANNAIRGLYTKDPTQYTLITKLTLAQYLEECLREDGQFRPFYRNFASFMPDFRVNEPLSEDPDDRAIQIAAFYGKMREYPPQIFIQDRGYPYRPLSLGGFSEGWNVENDFGDQIIRITDAVKIPISITAVTMDEQEIEHMRAFLSAAFGQIGQPLTTRWILHPARTDGVYWEVRLPFDNNMSEVDHSPLHNDPERHFWQATLSMEVDFENSSYMRYQAEARFSPLDRDLTVRAPNQISLRGDTQVTVLHRSEPIAMFSNDHRVAVVRQRGTAYFIEPRKVGTFQLMVTKASGPDQGPRILHQQDVTVTAV